MAKSANKIALNCRIRTLKLKGGDMAHDKAYREAERNM